MPSDTPQCCPHCKGETVYRTRIGTTEGPVSIFTCWCCGWLQDIDDPRRYMQRDVVKRQDERIKCAVVGCENMVQVETTTTGRCTKCNRLMREWERGAKTKPAPLIVVAGVWIKNPARK